MRPFRALAIAVSAGILAIAIATPVYAGALLRLTPGGLSAFGYEEAGYPVEPVIITSDTFRLTFLSEGANKELANPVLLIVAAPDGTIPTVEKSDDINGFTDVTVAPIGPTYGGTWDPDGSGGVFDQLSDPKFVYELLGLDGGNNSQNYDNWTGATGLTSWNLFVFGIVFDPEMTSGSYAEFTSNLPNGSYIIGYGCQTVYAGECTNNGKTQSTPFTFAGLVRVPEPATLTLLVPGVVALLTRRRSAQLN